MTSVSQRVPALLLALVLVTGCSGSNKLDEVERRPLPASPAKVHAEVIRYAVRTGLARRLLAEVDLAADLEWHLSWISQVESTRSSFDQLLQWCTNRTECNVGLKLLRPDLPPLAIPNITHFLQAIGAEPLYRSLRKNREWLENAKRSLKTASTVIDRLAPLVVHADTLTTVQERQLIREARATRDALRSAAATMREGAARSSVIGKVASDVAVKMRAATVRLDPFWEVGAARVAQGAAELVAIGARAEAGAEALEVLAASLALDAKLVGDLSVLVDRLLYP